MSASDEAQRLQEVETELKAAREAFARSDPEEAERRLRAGLAKAPDHPWCNSLLGAILAERGLSDEASRSLYRAAEVSQYGDPLIVSNLVTFLLTMPVDAARLDAAERALRQALETNGFAISHAQLGWVLELQGQARAARAQYLRALRMPMGFPHGEGRADLGDWYELALAGLLRTTLALSPGRIPVPRQASEMGEAKPPPARKRWHARVWDGYLGPNIAWVVTVLGSAFAVIAHVQDLLPSALVGVVLFLSCVPPVLAYARRYFKRIDLGPGRVSAIARDEETPRQYAPGPQ